MYTFSKMKSSCHPFQIQIFHAYCIETLSKTGKVFSFQFAIKKFDLKTPGREDDDDLEAEKKVELGSNDYTAIAAKILEGCGGKENITSIDNCITRLRLEVKDITAVSDKVIKSAGVAGVIKPGKTSVQVIIGPKVQFVADEFSKLCE